MKPMGLTDPRTGRRPWAVVQLRQENLRAQSFNLVGFQNHMKFGDQARVLRLIPGLEKAEFLRFGQIHRNTYINAPSLLTPTLQLRADPRIFFAGQISGVEGYVEAIATGLMAGIHAAALASGAAPRPLSRETALGSLCHYISAADPANYQPANITFDLLPQLDEPTRLKLRRDKRRATPKSAAARRRRWRNGWRGRCLNWPRTSTATSRNSSAATTPPTRWTLMPPICASFCTIFRRPKPNRPRPAPSTC